MTRFMLLVTVCVFVLVGSGRVHAAVKEHTFNSYHRSQRKIAGPTIHAHEGDTLIVHVINDSPYNITIHWHGVYQLLSGWADGPNMITQCPIVPGKSYTYKFNITGQEGTLWWHSHVSTLRATVYGALIIRPRAGTLAYPFPKPHKEVPILLGEWWNANVVDVDTEAFLSGGAPNISDAYTINGRPGDLYRCSSNHTYKLEVVQGKTYMLRIINAALNNQLFFKIAGHTFTVVAVDASYTVPYPTDVIVIAPGQTVDALMIANATPSQSYYMAASAYMSASNVSFDNTTATAILHYKNSPSSELPIMPSMPAFNDTPTAYKFYSSLLGLVKPGLRTVPLDVDEKMFVTTGLGQAQCGADQPKCQGQALAASMNNVSFQFPTKMSILEAHFRNVTGVYTADFPDNPPTVFDYTNPSVNSNTSLVSTVKGTRVKRVKYNATVEMVLQNTAILAIESHPMHLHGYDFFVVAQGFGNFNESRDAKGYNLVCPQARNTIAVPAGGWAVIRFKANNPGVWIMHCHLDVHLNWGLAMVFEVENGPTPSTTLPPPPPDFPTC